MKLRATLSLLSSLATSWTRSRHSLSLSGSSPEGKNHPMTTYDEGTVADLTVHGYSEPQRAMLCRQGFGYPHWFLANGGKIQEGSALIARIEPLEVLQRREQERPKQYPDLSDLPGLALKAAQAFRGEPRTRAQ